MTDLLIHVNAELTLREADSLALGEPPESVARRVLERIVNCGEIVPAIILAEEA